MISIPILIYAFMDGRHRTPERYDFLPTIENEPDSETVIGIENKLKTDLQDRDERTPITEVFGLRHVHPALMPDIISY